MNPSFQLLAETIGYLVLLAALGSGPVSWAGGSPAGIVLMPAAGFALAAGVLTTVSVVLPMNVAAFAVLLPGSVASAVWAVALQRRSRESQLRDAIPALVLTALGAIMAIVPALLRGTLGPISLRSYDAWYYIQADTYLQQYRSSASLPASAALNDLVLTYGHSAADRNRIGPDEVNAAVSALFNQPPAAVHMAMLAALFGAVPASVLFCARSLGAGRLAASFGALFGLSAAILTLVADSTLGNLAATVLAAPFLVVCVHAVVDPSSWRPVILAGILGAGLVSCYPEFLAPTVLTLLIALAGAVIQRTRRAPGVPVKLHSLLLRLVSVGAAMLAFGAAGAVEAAQYLPRIAPLSLAGLPPRFIGPHTFGAWAFGVLHLYQVPRYALLSTPKQAIALGLPILLAGILLVGVVRAGWAAAGLVLGAIVVSMVLSRVAYSSFQGGTCEYCQWKAYTYFLPFLGIGVALGFQHCAISPRATGRSDTAVRVLVGGTAAIAVLALARADEALLRAVYESPAIITTAMRNTVDALHGITEPRSVYIEAANGTAAPAYTVPGLYNLVRETGSTVEFDARGAVAEYLAPVPPLARYYSPTYTYVLTPFAGVRSDRLIMKQSGNWALERRAPIDVGVAATGWAIDPAEGASAVLWVQGPFELWIASPSRTDAILRLELKRAPGRTATLALSEGATALPAVTSEEGTRVCAPVRLGPGTTVISVSPSYAPLIPQGQGTEADPVPPPQKVLAVTALKANPATSANRC